MGLCMYGTLRLPRHRTDDGQRSCFRIEARKTGRTGTPVTMPSCYSLYLVSFPERVIWGSAGLSSIAGGDGAGPERA